MHPNSQKLHDLLKEAGDLHDSKQVDYGTPTDPFNNLVGSLDWGIEPWIGACVRMNDKVKRLQAYVRNGSLKHESARDSLMDIAVYALIAIVLLEGENSNAAQ